mmetsp:Transcript_18346/g.41783  ORF Transcript_18346/g.41783 Transcript_18346/m.41783 type:complete len:203 (-) Transcript_18346:67-675(-)
MEGQSPRDVCDAPVPTVDQLDEENATSGLDAVHDKRKLPETRHMLLFSALSFPITGHRHVLPVIDSHPFQHLVVKHEGMLPRPDPSHSHVHGQHIAIDRAPLLGTKDLELDVLRPLLLLLFLLLQPPPPLLLLLLLLWREELSSARGCRPRASAFAPHSPEHLQQPILLHRTEPGKGSEVLISDIVHVLLSPHPQLLADPLG